MPCDNHTRAVIIGQGAAGLTAALTVARKGIQVTSISKVGPGGATCTMYAGGGFTLGIGGVTPEDHKTMTLETGRHLNRCDLLCVFAQEAPSIVKILESIGVGFREHRGGLSIEKDPAFPLLGGKPLLDGLYHACLDAGVQFRPNLIASRILTDDKGVFGLECVDYKSASVETIKTAAVLLATGGGGALYQWTDNPQRITGDGYRLAFLSGCELLDMEFVQFYPIGINIPGGAHWFMDLSIIDRARLTNCRGEEFLKEMLRGEGIMTGRKANLLARDKCSVAIALAEKEGPVLLHLEDVGQEVFENEPYLKTIARMFPKSSPPWAGPVEVHPIEHYFPGGVAIGTWGETSLPGLFAAGEVTGGVDGANRVGGNALTNCLLFGSRAGERAAGYICGDSVGPDAVKPGPFAGMPTDTAHSSMANDFRSGSRLPIPPEHGGEKWLEFWKDGTVNPKALRKEMQSLASEYLMPLRDEQGLYKCLNMLEEKAHILSKQRVRNYEDILLAFENLGLWYTAAFVTLGAYLRKESRGPHFRRDYPDERKEWERHIFIGKSGGEIAVIKP